MTAKPETAAEVLAESIKTAIAHEKESGEFRRSDVLLLLSSAQDAVDALSAQGEAVAGTVVGHDSFGREVIDWNGEEALPAGTKLYTHPAPARVTEEMVERACVAYFDDEAWAHGSEKIKAKARRKMHVSLTAALEN